MLTKILTPSFSPRGDIFLSTDLVVSMKSLSLSITSELPDLTVRLLLTTLSSKLYSFITFIYFNYSSSIGVWLVKNELKSCPPDRELIYDEPN